MGKKFFVKIVSNPDVDMRKCIVGLACAAQAIDDGHAVSMFYAADGVKMLKSDYVNKIDESGMLPKGMVTGMISKITNGAVDIFSSTGSLAANGVNKDNAKSVLLDGFEDWMTWSGPPGVIELSAKSDVQLVY